MDKTIGSIALLTPAFLCVEGFLGTAPGQAKALPELSPDLREAVCLNDWHRSVNLISPLIGSATITPEHRQDLVEFSHQLQTWRATRAEVSNIPNCERVEQAQDHRISTNIPVSLPPSVPLNFAAALQSVETMRSLPQGSIRYQSPQGYEFNSQDCWMIDSNGQRLNLNSLCES